MTFIEPALKHWPVIPQECRVSILISLEINDASPLAGLEKQDKMFEPQVLDLGNGL